MLEVEGLRVYIDSKKERNEVVKGISFSVKEGEILGIVGESGSGKSITALSIAGLLNPESQSYSGKILFQDEDLAQCNSEKMRKIQGNQISMIFQEPMTSLNPLKKIGWQIEESLRIHKKMSKQQRKEQVLKMLKDVELKDVEKVYGQYPHELSGGMRQRAMIAAAMISIPRLLIADEPTTALDVTIQAQIVKLLQKMNQEYQTAILFISHDLSLVKELCDKTLVMKDGMIVEMGKSEEIFRNPQADYTRELIQAIPQIPASYYDEGRQIWKS